MLDEMTTSGHNMVMKRIRIAELKSHLSEHLRDVRREKTITVLDRDTPVARIVPIRQNELHIRHAEPNAPPLGKIRLPRVRTKLPFDIVDLVLEGRAKR